MRILVSNDDSVHARGIHALAKELGRLGKVWVVAPLEEKSTTGHSLTLHKPLRLMKLGKNIWGVSGSPADCVYVGIREVLGGMPDLVVSGINRGANLGQDVYYSGTVSAAREACILGIPSLAVSLSVDFSKRPKEDSLRYDAAAKVALDVARKIRALPPPHHSFWNLNVPNLTYARLKGIRLARQGFRFYSGNIIKRVDHRGKPYYWVGGEYKGFHNAPDTDCSIVESGYSSLTPLRLDTTDFGVLEEWAEHAEKLRVEPPPLAHAKPRGRAKK